MSRKAQLRNPDEFYHKMRRMKKDDRTGELIKIGRGTKEEKTNMAKARRMEETQNISLVNLRRSIEAKKTERLQKNLHLIDFERKANHIYFVNSVDEIKNEGSIRVGTNHTNEELDAQMSKTQDTSILSQEKQLEYIQQLKYAQSDNKK